MRTTLVFILLLPLYTEAFGQQQDPMRGHKIRHLAVNGIPENAVDRWWEDAPVYTVKKTKLDQKIKLKNRVLNASLEFDTVDFKHGLEFDQDSLYALEFWQCKVNSFRLSNLKTESEVIFDSCYNMHADIAMLRKKYKHGGIGPVDEVYSSIGGNHFGEVSFQRSALASDLESDNNIYKKLSFNGHIGSVSMNNDSVSGQCSAAFLGTDSLYCYNWQLHSWRAWCILLRV